ncbi:hypothetical protein NQ314_008523 [Rhamnusium bicolor]|uniref:MOSC domain-containing protein n=1 Tax=Rhamnusium bicolor TaxID=1586634 RepID=A0AAV8Y9Y1_9CUCU|nr:hypothetical protein NQ314_008523 [Rhamnusium bicolor]
MLSKCMRLGRRYYRFVRLYKRGYKVLHISNLHGIHLRTGCFCNPGACQRFLKLTPSDVVNHFNAGHVCGDQHDLVENCPTGSVRISFGYMSMQEDADQFLNMIETCFVSKPVIKTLPSNWYDIRRNYEELFVKFSEINKNVSPVSKIVNVNTDYNNDKYVADDYIVNMIKKDDEIGILQQILVYPVKSCGAFLVTDNWTLTPTGLKYDREWMIINPSGICLTQKHNKKLCLIKPEINVKKKILKLRFKGQSDIDVSLIHPSNGEYKAYLCQSKVCGDRIQGWDCGDEVSEWLSINLDMPGLRLLRQCNSTKEILGRFSSKDATPQLSLANKAQYLLLNLASVTWLMQKVSDGELNEDTNSVILRFRPNFLVSFTQPFHENKFEMFSFDNILLKSSGKCTRCQMICINQNTGEISKEPLHSLSREFKGKVTFGIYLNQEVSDREITLSLGSKVIGRNKSV